MRPSCCNQPPAASKSWECARACAPPSSPRARGPWSPRPSTCGAPATARSERTGSTGVRHLGGATRSYAGEQKKTSRRAASGCGRDACFSRVRVRAARCDCCAAAAAAHLLGGELHLHLPDVTLHNLALGEADRRSVGGVPALLRCGRVDQARHQGHAQDAHRNLADLVLPKALPQSPAPRHKHAHTGEASRKARAGARSARARRPAYLAPLAAHTHVHDVLGLCPHLRRAVRFLPTQCTRKATAPPLGQHQHRDSEISLPGYSTYALDPRGHTRGATARNMARACAAPAPAARRQRPARPAQTPPTFIVRQGALCYFRLPLADGWQNGVRG